MTFRVPWTHPLFSSSLLPSFHSSPPLPFPLLSLTWQTFSPALYPEVALETTVSLKHHKVGNGECSLVGRWFRNLSQSCSSFIITAPLPVLSHSEPVASVLFQSQSCLWVRLASPPPCLACSFSFRSVHKVSCLQKTLSKVVPQPCPSPSPH